MNKSKNIVVLDYNHREGIPVGRDVFYLCLNCKSIIQSYPDTNAACKCGNVVVDIDASRGGANDISKLLILKIE